MNIGANLLKLRNDANKSKEEFADKLGVSVNDISNWEENKTSPSITVLPKIAEFYGVSVDALLSNEIKNKDNLMLKINVDSKNGERVRINIPISLVKIGYDIGMNIPQVAGNDIIKNIDIPKIMELIDNGGICKLIDVENTDGTVVSVCVE